MARVRVQEAPGSVDVRELQLRLRAAEAALRAIGAGEVDAFVAPSGERVITLAGAELADHIVVEQMNEGAVTLTRDGVVAYCNRRLAEMLGTSPEAIVGASLVRFVARGEIAQYEGLRHAGLKGNARGDVTFRTADRAATRAVAVSFAPLRTRPAAAPIGIVGVLRDISERREAERERERLTGLLITAQEEERRRLARELHDEIGQSLTAVLVGLRTIEGAQNPARSGGLARALRETTARTLADVGRMWRGLHPGVLDEVEFPLAIERHVKDFAQTHGIKVKVDVGDFDTPGLTMPVLATVYRVIQESLNNVAQHAAAETVKVALRRTDGWLEVAVEDDGEGFVPGSRNGLGLRSMRERATLLGGSVDVVSRLGKGTKVVVRIPVKSP